MFKGVIFSQSGGGAWFPLNTSGGYVYEHSDLATCKKECERTINHQSYKAQFSGGYDIWILNTKDGTVASRAKTEIPSISWQDAPTPEPTTK